MKHLRVHEVAEQLMVGPDAVRKYVSMGLLECSRTPSGQRVFTQEQVDAFRGISPAPVIAFYVRSSNGDKARMDSQVVALTKEYGAPVQVFSDKSSGLNENRRGLTRMIESAKKGEFTVLCVTQNDRLSRFGFTYLEDHLATLGVTVNVAVRKSGHVIGGRVDE